MSYDEIPSFIEQLRKREAIAALALEFTILTAAGTGETLGATWDEVNLDKALWTKPAKRIKVGKEHRVPLSPRKVEILRQVSALDKPYLFPGSKGGKLSGMAMSMLMRRMKVDATVHGFRSSFRDWCADETLVTPEVAETALAHTISNAVERTYRRSDLFAKRRRLMNKWARFCGSFGATEENVTPIRRSAAA